MSGGTPVDAPRLRLRGIRRTFGTVVAVDDVDLDVHAGHVHALLGENGAGKSTLMNVVFGVHRRDAGTIEVDGRPVDVREPADAIAAGVAMVHQHHRLVPSLTVAETLLLGERGTRLDRTGAAQRVCELAAQLEVELDPAAVVGDLSLGGRQRVEILMAVHRDARVLVLDEPTAVLAPSEVDPLLRLLRRIAADGCAVILISHRMREVFAVSDDISVMRRGRLVSTAPTALRTEQEVLAELVTTREPETPSAGPGAERAAASRAALLEVNDLQVPARPGSTGLRGLSLDVRPGEVLGVAGVEGNGQSELVEVLAGIVAPSAGTVAVDRRVLRGRPSRSVLTVVPEDRHHQGLVLDLSTAENLALDHLGEYTRAGMLRRGAMRADADQVIAGYGVVTSSADAPVRSMSGGNQQKVVLARALAARPEVLVVSQPTRGLDPGAARDVLVRVRRAAADGAAVLLISSDVDEVIDVSDRVVVMFAGAVTGVSAHPSADRARLLALMTGSTSGRDVA